MNTNTKDRMLIVAFMLVMAVLAVCVWRIVGREQEYRRQIEQLNWQVKTARRVDSLRTAEATAIEVRHRDLQSLNADLAGEVERLKIANRRLTAAAAVHSVAYVRDTAYITDTLVVVQRADTAYIDTLQCLRWSDTWSKVEACHRKGDTAADMLLSVADTLLLTVRREPRWRVLGIRIGTKGYTVAVRHTCPHVVTHNVLFVKR